MNKQSYDYIEKEMDDKKSKIAKQSTKRMKVSGKSVLKLAKIILKKKK